MIVVIILRLYSIAAAITQDSIEETGSGQIEDNIRSQSGLLSVHVHSSSTPSEPAAVQESMSTELQSGLAEEAQDISIHSHSPSGSGSSANPHIGIVPSSSGASSTSKLPFKSPQQFRGFPKAEQRKAGRKGREKGRSIIATDTPEKNALELKQSKRKIKSKQVVVRAKKERN